MTVNRVAPVGMTPIGINCNVLTSMLLILNRHRSSTCIRIIASITPSRVRLTEKNRKSV